VKVEIYYTSTPLNEEVFKSAASFIGAFDWETTYVPDMSLETYNGVNFNWCLPHICLVVTIRDKGKYFLRASFEDCTKITIEGLSIGEPLPKKVLEALKKPQETNQ